MLALARAYFETRFPITRSTAAAVFVALMRVFGRVLIRFFEGSSDDFEGVCSKLETISGGSIRFVLNSILHPSAIEAPIGTGLLQANSDVYEVGFGFRPALRAS